MGSGGHQKPWKKPILKVRWPSGLRRQTKDLVRKGVGSNPTLITFFLHSLVYAEEISAGWLATNNFLPCRDKIHHKRRNCIRGYTTFELIFD
jgi:hypothetical protein